MKKNSILINVGRGDTVNEKALLKKINSNSAFIAVLDVFNKEPLPKKHSFWKKENLYITPHISSLTEVNSAVDQIHNLGNIYFLELNHQIKIFPDSLNQFLILMIQY